MYINFIAAIFTIIINFIFHFIIRYIYYIYEKYNIIINIFFKIDLIEKNLH